jgi:hypothetical protein
MRRSLVPALFLIAAAPATTGIAPGNWHKLDRNDPMASARTGTSVCLAQADAGSPGRWLLGASGVGCEIDHESYDGGQIAIHATCPARAGEKPGSLTASGRWTPDRLHLRYSSVTYGGDHTFSHEGTIEARRLGPCES